MRIRLEMELADVLRISVLLDHHRKECADEQDKHMEPAAKVFSAWGAEAAQLNEKLLKAALEMKG